MLLLIWIALKNKNSDILIQFSNIVFQDFLTQEKFAMSYRTENVCVIEQLSRKRFTTPVRIRRPKGSRWRYQRLVPEVDISCNSKWNSGSKRKATGSKANSNIMVNYTHVNHSFNTLIAVSSYAYANWFLCIFVYAEEVEVYAERIMALQQRVQS